MAFFIAQRKHGEFLSFCFSRSIRIFLSLMGSLLVLSGRCHCATTWGLIITEVLWFGRSVDDRLGIFYRQSLTRFIFGLITC